MLLMLLFYFRDPTLREMYRWQILLVASVISSAFSPPIWRELYEHWRWALISDKEFTTRARPMGMEATVRAYFRRDLKKSKTMESDNERIEACMALPRRHQIEVKS